MKKKRRHNEVQPEPVAENLEEQEQVQEPVVEQQDQDKPVEDTFVERRPKKIKTAYSRVNVDPSRKYQTHESRESWGPNVKGKKFRKEKGKKKRCGNAGIRIDGSVKSTRLDA